MLLSFDLGLKHMGACAIDRGGKIHSWVILTPKSDCISDIKTELDTWISCFLVEHEDIAVILERQPWKNYKMTRLFVIMETYINVAFPRFKVFKVSSNTKWNYLKRSVPPTYYERKREIITVCEKMLKENTENETWLEWFRSQEKKDDLADAYIQSLVIL